MKFNQKYLHYAVIGLLLILLFLQRECSNCPDCPEAVNSHTEVWHYDSTIIKKEIAVPYPVEKLVPYGIPAIVDTSAILADYFARYVYDRILLDDSSAFIRLRDTTWRNRIMKSSLEFINRRPTQIVTNTTIVSDKVNKVFVGPVVGGSLNGNLIVGAGALLVTKRDNGYQVLVDPFNRSLSLGAYWKISFRNKNKQQ